MNLSGYYTWFFLSLFSLAVCSFLRLLFKQAQRTKQTAREKILQKYQQVEYPDRFMNNVQTLAFGLLLISATALQATSSRERIGVSYYTGPGYRYEGTYSYPGTEYRRGYPTWGYGPYYNYNYYPYNDSAYTYQGRIHYRHGYKGYGSYNNFNQGNR